MDLLRVTLEQQPLMALFLTISIGYLLGEVNIKGFSLGVGAVLFVALGMGWLVPMAVPAPMIGTLGLALFLYAVGVQYGRQFFDGLTSRKGLTLNLIALVGVLLSGIVSLLLTRATGLATGYGLGLFAGSGTSTPALQAAIAAIGNDDPAIGYPVSYPFGVAGPILCLYLVHAWLKPTVQAPSSAGSELRAIHVREATFFGMRLAEVAAMLPRGAQVVALRRHEHSLPALPLTAIAQGDVLLVVAPTNEVLDTVERIVGEAASERFTDRRDLDYLRVFASRPAIVGRALGDLELPGDNASVVAHVRRGDVDLQAERDLVVEFGDRIGVLAHRDDFRAIRTFFGDSIRGTAEFSYISIGLGMALGFLLGAIAIPLPGVGTISLGLSGVLIVALVVGSARRMAGLNWTIPLSASLVLRNLGLTLFLGQIGMSSGPRFAAAMTGDGPLMMVIGAAVTLAAVVPILVLGLAVFKVPFDEVCGIISGACPNPAILAYANRLAPNDAPDLGYAMVQPGMTILKILFVNIVPSFL